MQNSLINGSGPDSFLLEELKKGNSRAFDVLFKNYYDNLCRFAFSFIHETDMAQSLVQNVFIKLWEKRFVLGNIQNIGGYLTTMVKNQCSDYIKEQRIYDPSAQYEKSGEIDNSTEQTILGNNFEECLVIALSKLPPRCRLAFGYSRFEGMSNKKIALEMNISIKAVEALIGRSLKLLRIELREFLPSFDLKKINPILLFYRISKKNWKIM